MYHCREEKMRPGRETEFEGKAPRALAREHILIHNLSQGIFL